MPKGSIFSVDVLLAFLFCSFLFASIASSEFGFLLEASGFFKSFELEEKALMLTDFAVKSRNLENPLLGSAFFDPEKRRLVSNLLDSSLFQSAKPVSFGSLQVSSFSLNAKGFGRKPVFFNPKLELSGKCIAVQRFVLLYPEMRKAVLEMVVCES
ncbi:MAG TPA: hypothetical protein HA222_00075 [Candidatus Diapherotrites archaeon]|uniref:Uncharacterized protein n=1 Tax=Candidatus Iainarchaeum sp. TaxID=3101447 RepID=A0A7J4JXU9_9ARCH|nr:hypothetical protein [Candidatus Diapherotrites archaeon]